MRNLISKLPITAMIYISVLLIALYLSGCKQTYTAISSSHPAPLIKLKQFYAQRGYIYKSQKQINDSTLIITFKK